MLFFIIMIIVRSIFDYLCYQYIVSPVRRSSFAKTIVVSELKTTLRNSSHLSGSVYMGGGTGRLPGRRDVFIPALKTVYMGGGTGRLPGRDVNLVPRVFPLTDGKDLFSSIAKIPWV